MDKLDLDLSSEHVEDFGPNPSTILNPSAQITMAVDEFLMPDEVLK